MSKRIDFVNGMKEMNESDLKARIQEDELRLKKLEFAHAISPLENPMSIRSLRKDVARLKTELKKKGLPWEKAKAWDGSAVLGKLKPVSPEILKNPIEFSLLLNDEVVQKGNSRLMIFPFNRIIEDISQYFAINIGDLIYTGTPAGVGTDFRA